MAYKFAMCNQCHDCKFFKQNINPFFITDVDPERYNVDGQPRCQRKNWGHKQAYITMPQSTCDGSVISL